MAYPARRKRRARARAVLAAIAAAGALALVPAPASAATASFDGAWYCQDRGQYFALPGAKIEVWRTLLPPGYPSSYAWMATQKLATGYTDNLGRYSFTTTEGGNYFVRLVLHDANDVHMGAWYLPWDWSVDTETLSASSSVQHFGNLAIGNDEGAPHCAAWRGVQIAYQDYQATIGERPPGGERLIQADAPNAGVPFTLYDAIWWPDGYEPDPDNATQFRVTKHEFGHTVRHRFDGNLAHFFLDVGHYDYLQQHQACKKTNAGFAFNEGWAEYWAQDYWPAPSCAGQSSTDYTIEGNVAAALTSLQDNCQGVTRKTMVNVLRNNPAGIVGGIHSFDDFKSHITCRPKIGVNPPPLTQAESAEPKDQRNRFRSDVLSFYKRLAKKGNKQLPGAIRVSHNPPSCRDKPCFSSLLALVKPDVLRGQIAIDKTISKQLAFLKSKKQFNKLGNPLGRKFANKLKSIRRAIRKAIAKYSAQTLANLLKDGKPIFKKDKSPDMMALKRVWIQLEGPFKKGRIPSGFVLPFARLDARKHAPPGDLRRSSTLTLTCPANSNFGDPVPVSGTLTPARNGTTVHITYSQPGTTPTTHTVTTDAFGNYSDTFTPDLAQAVTSQASFSGDPERKPSQSSPCTPTYNPIP